MLFLNLYHTIWNWSLNLKSKLNFRVCDWNKIKKPLKLILFWISNIHAYCINNISMKFSFRFQIALFANHEIQFQFKIQFQIHWYKFKTIIFRFSFFFFFCIQAGLWFSLGLSPHVQHCTTKRRINLFFSLLLGVLPSLVHVSAFSMYLFLTTNHWSTLLVLPAHVYLVLDSLLGDRKKGVLFHP